MRILVSNYFSHSESYREFLEIFLSLVKDDKMIHSEVNFQKKAMPEKWEKVFDIVFAKYSKKIIKTKKEPERLKLIRELGEKYQFFISYEMMYEKNNWKIVPRQKSAVQLGTVYTPPEITEFICKWILQNRVNLREKSDSDLKIADIACGTGQFLFEWKLLSKSFQTDHKLSFFGYDNDPMAIKIAKLGNFPEFSYKQGDSLFYRDLEDSDQFDIIVGNPPYIKSSAIEENYWRRLKEKYKSAYQKFDISVIFLEKSLKLLKPGGIAGFITSNKWLISKYGLKIRDMLLKNSNLLAIIDVSHIRIFSKASTYPVIIFFEKRTKEMDQKKNASVPTKIDLIQINQVSDLKNILSGKHSGYKINQNFYQFTPQHSFITNFSVNELDLLQHFWNIPSDSYFLINDKKSPYTLRKGIHTGNCKKKLIINLIPATDFENSEIKPLITSRQKIERYKISWQGLWVKYNKSLIEKSKGDYGSLREPWIFEACPKILIKLFGIRIQAAIDFFRYYVNNSVIILLRKDQNPNFHPEKSSIYLFKSVFPDVEDEFYYILGILNSNLISSYYRIMYRHTHVRGNYLQYYIKDLGKIPIMRHNKQNFKLIREISQLTKRIVKLHESFLENREEIEKQEKILNKKVDKLYGFDNSSI